MGISGSWFLGFSGSRFSVLGSQANFADRDRTSRTEEGGAGERGLDTAVPPFLLLTGYPPFSIADSSG